MNIISFGQRNSGGTQTYDEIRFGPTFNGVVPMASTLASFTITGIPAQVPLGQPVTGITLTAKDANNQPVTSFNGTVTFGGTAGITGTSAAFTNGVLTGVSITPSIVRVELTFTVDDGAGHTGSAPLNVVNLFTDWAAQNNLSGPSADPMATPMNDGVTNLQKFAFGMNPAVAASGLLVLGENSELITPGLPMLHQRANIGTPTDFDAIFMRRKNHHAAGIQYIVQFSADLHEWVASTAVPAVVSAPAESSDVEAVAVPFPESITTQDGLKEPSFFRIRVRME